MPIQTVKVIRRKVTPVRKKLQDDVWDHTLSIMGLEPLSSTNKSPTMETANAIATPKPSLTSATKRTILDLPIETQKEIFTHASPSDLIALSLVSKDFRDVAAEVLYRSFHIVFPDEEDPTNDSPIDGLAGGLDTFVTSEYNYARHLREIILETLSGGSKSEAAYRNYMYDVSCGKFLNTLLLLTLRKAKALETFKWDIRVELSRQVFGALHGIPALQNLHLRMQAGRSIYQAPPAISAPVSSAPSSTASSATFSSTPSFSTLPPSSTQASLTWGPPHAVQQQSPPVTIYIGGATNQFPSASKAASKNYHKYSNARLPAPRKNPPTLSGFHKLKSLAVLDMDTLDYLSELKECIKNSSSSLHTLKISFSESLANKSRKPPPEVHSDDDSDVDDDFGQGMPPPGPPPGLPSSSVNDPSAPSKALKAQEEKKKQEAALAKIFGLEALAKHVPATAEVERKPVEDPKRTFIRNLAPIAKLLMATLKDGTELSDAGKEALMVITKAAKLYVDAVEKGKTPGTKTPESAESTTPKATPASSIADETKVAETDAAQTDAAEPGLFDEPEPKKKGKSVDSDVSNPDDIDVEAPEVQELAIELDPPETTEATETIDSKTAVEVASSTQINDTITWANSMQHQEHKLHLQTSYEDALNEKKKLLQQVDDLAAKKATGQLDGTEYGKLAAMADDTLKRMTAKLNELRRLEGEVTARIHDESPQSSENTTKMSEYIRETRGLTLHTLAIYLIPIKASILTRAIDFHVLQEITLLNVGPQIPFWNAVAKENKLSPLPLRKIHTDNVTLPFLALVNQLDEVNELFLLERRQNTKVESTAAKTTVTMEQIRRIALKRHAATLKVLMIRNDSDSKWDLDVKSTILLCQRAKQLEELAVSFGTRTMHTLLQFIPGLINLRALYTIQFRSEDTCMWVMHEFRKFAVDNISHNPEMKLEYLALTDSVERLVRRPPPTPKKTDRKGKGKDTSNYASGKKSWTKGKSLGELALMQNGGVFPQDVSVSGGINLLNLGSMPGLGIDWGDSEDDDLEVGGKQGLRVETVEGVRFCDVPGVRIFEKDILGGRL